MVTVPIDPIIFSFGGHIALRWYSLIVMAAIALGVWLGAREAARRRAGTGEIHKERVGQRTLDLIHAALPGRSDEAASPHMLRH